MIYLDAGTTYSKVISTENCLSEQFLVDVRDENYYYIVPSSIIKTSDIVPNRSCGHMSNASENEIIALAKGAQKLEIDSDATILDLGSRDAKWIRFKDGKFHDMDWNTSCASSTGATVEMLMKFYGVNENELKYDAEKKEFVYENFSELLKDQYGNEKEVSWLVKDAIQEQYFCADKDAIQMMPLMAKNNLLCYLIDTSKFEHLEEMKKIIIAFAEKIDIINMNNIPMEHTIKLMKNRDQLQQKIVDFIKNADLYMDNYEYVDMDQIKLRAEDEGEKPDEKVLGLSETIMDQIRLVSTYKGIPVPSLLFDSTGTKKIAALAGYVIEGLEQGRILVIDELDSSIHFKLTRAIVAMFNNELNVNAQMIFTVHDINLMDCKKMFRKEQIWFVHKDKEGVYVYSLADFTAQQGVRDTTDIMEKYRKGALGALPDPDLINSLLNIKGNEKGGVTDDK